MHALNLILGLVINCVLVCGLFVVEQRVGKAGEEDAGLRYFLVCLFVCFVLLFFAFSL
jgi:hypothetical protein